MTEKQREILERYVRNLQEIQVRRAQVQRMIQDLAEIILDGEPEDAKINLDTLEIEYAEVQQEEQEEVSDSA